MVRAERIQTFLDSSVPSCLPTFVGTVAEQTRTVLPVPYLPSQSALAHYPTHSRRGRVAISLLLPLSGWSEQDEVGV